MIAHTLAICLFAASVPNIETLVRELGAPSYSARERAAAALRQLGDEAIPLLEKAEQSSDPELRLRAREILADLRLGIRPDWPVELAELVRGYSRLEQRERSNALHRLWNALNLRAMPFLSARLARGDSEEQNTIRSLFHTAAEETVQKMRTALREQNFTSITNLASRYTFLTAHDSRLLYLEAEALDLLKQPTDAAARRQQALQSAPDREEPHYAAATMLEELKHPDLAAAEWQLILKIPPADDVYDINARLRLSDLAAAARRFTDAADQLQFALNLYRKAKAKGGAGYGLVGGSEKAMEERIRAFRARAQQKIAVNFAITVKDEKLDELQRALKDAFATITIGIQPRGFRLFDIPAGSVIYNPEKQTLSAGLNGAACGEPIEMKLAAKSRVIVQALDCYYVYSVDPASGKTEKLARYEKDYTLRLTPSAEVDAWTNITLKINGESKDWSDAKKGLNFDYLPDKLDIQLEGDAPTGKRETIHLEMPIEEPSLNP